MSAPTSIRRLQAHYFAIFAVFGAVTPYISIYLRDVKGLSPSEMGNIFATGQSAVLFMPVLMTYLADKYRVVRPLLVTLFALNLIAMTALAGALGFWACLLWISFNRLATQPQVALSDGLYFTLQAEPDQPKAPFSKVRVWGTIGFIAPSIVFYLGYEFGGGITWIPWVTAAAAALGIINAFGLPMRSAAISKKPSNKVPTLEAARVLARPPLALFSIGVGFVFFTNMAFYGFYPLYLTSEVNIAEKWIGPISSLGVGMEIFYVLALDRLKKRFGFEGIIALGAIASLFRLACLAYLPTPFFAVFFQVFHGLTVIGFMIVPVMYLNTHAEEGYRNSIQGLFIMLVAGAFSIAGNIVAGQIAEIGLLTLFRASLIFCLIGIVLIVVSFWLQRRADSKA